MEHVNLKSIGLSALSLALAVICCLFLLAGCSGTSTSSSDGTEVTDTDKENAQTAMTSFNDAIKSADTARLAEVFGSTSFTEVIDDNETLRTVFPTWADKVSLEVVSVEKRDDGSVVANVMGTFPSIMRAQDEELEALSAVQATENASAQIAQILIDRMNADSPSSRGGQIAVYKDGSDTWRVDPSSAEEFFAAMVWDTDYLVEAHPELVQTDTSDESEN